MTRSPRPLTIAITGIVALAVSVGIGRFAFTPLLPMMLGEGVVSLAQASWLASANYLGYLVGALLCTVSPWLGARLGVHRTPGSPALARVGLVLTALLTAAMAVQAPALWAGLRFAAGVSSAFVFVYGSSWCLSSLARHGQPSLGALMFTGPGLGIVASGLTATATAALRWPAWAGWLLSGVLAAVLTASVWAVLRPVAREDGSPAAETIATNPGTSHGALEIALLALAYGLAGFGYIVTATFLPVIAGQALPGSPWLDLFWPVFGVGAIVGAVLAFRIRRPGDLRMMLCGCYVVQALGVSLSIVSPTAAGFAIGSLLLGLTFTTITFFALQEIRRVRPAQASRFIGLVTATYGVGQIVGPPLAAAMVARSGDFSSSLLVAAGALAVGAALYALLARVYPMNVRRSG